jgi:phosphoribosylanthranilate isomerase
LVKVKICGVTCAQDATWAVNLGADFIGLNFYKDSPRKVSPQNALEIAKEIPPFVATVGVFVNEELKSLVKIAGKLNCQFVQLHGEETVEYCRELKAALPAVKVIKAFRVQDETSLAGLAVYSEAAEYYLLDAFVPEVPGGTGATFNWDLAVKAKESGKLLFLSGGLNPDNVQEAIGKVKPFAVDVCSGIERSPKRKDYDKMKDFIAKVKQV